MSKVSSSSQSKIPPQLPSKSAWARGPPQSTSSAPSPRTQSPAPSSATPPATATHSRRPSALTGQGVSIKDGVSVPRSSASAVKQGSSVTFGSIDDASSAPISSSPASIPAIKAETVKSFGTVPASPSTTQANGKSPVGSVRTAANGSSGATHASKPISKADISKLFQNPSSNSSSPAVSSPPPTSSPSVRPSSLPQQTPPQGPQHPPSQPSQLGAGSYTPFTPSAQFRTPTTPANGPGQPPRSPVSFRPMTNGAGGAGARPSTGPTSPPGPPQAMPAAMPSPRMTPHPHPGTPAGLPPGTPVGWQPYYYSYMPGLPPEHYMPPYSPHGQWHMPPQGFPPQQHHPQSHLSHAPPGPPGPPHIMPMSPRNPPPPLQGPGTPTPAHALPAQHQPPSSSASSISSPPATPASLGPGPPTGNARLNTGASAFVPRQSKVVIKAADGKEVDLQELRKQQAQAGGPVAPPSPAPSPRRNIVRMETEEAKNKRLAEEREKERLKKEEERRKKEEAEEKERKEREEEERKKREEEKVRQEEAQKKKEEEARIRKEAEEEKERIRKEEEEKERLKREEEERIRKDEEEKERIKKEEERVRLEEEERMRKAEEEERLRKEEEEKMRKEEAAKAEPQPAEEANPQEPEMEDGEVKEDAPAAQESKEPKDSKAKEPLRIDTALSSPDVKRRPGPLDLSGARQATIPQPLPSALATARIIEDLGSVTYPEGIQSPKPELNANAKGGKFRYDRDFLLQFMSICKEKPDHLPPLDAIGLEPVGPDHYMTRGGSGRGNRSSSMGTPPLMRQASVGLGISNFGKPGGFAMGQFATPSSKLSSEERFAMANSGRGGAAGASAFGGRPPSMSRTPSQGGPGSGSGRTRSHRGNKRPEKNAGGPGGSSMSSFQHMQQNMGPPLEPVAPLQSTANRWTPNSLTRKPVNEDSPEIVDRKVRGLLNKLTMERFESISNQIIDWANKSEKEKDGRTLIQVIRLVFEKATDEAAWSEMYARLCRKMMEQISPNVQDEGIRNPEGKPITGGQLFRKYLLNRCQEDFERGWAAKEASAAAAKGKASEDAATAAANEGKEGDEAALYSEEYYAAQKAKRQGLGLVKFIGELFKLQMLTERIMHECIKKLLSNVDNPEEEEIESLCQLLTTIGQILDTPRAKQYMDIYFTRMKELAKNPKVSSRMQFMLQDVIELRERKWIPRNALAAPTTIAQVHQQAARDHAVAERESAQKMNNMSRGGSRRGQDRGEQQQADGWTAARPAKAGDLSNFGKISKPATMTFGPSGVFAGKNKESKRDSTISRSASGNMFSMLENAEAAQAAAKPSRPPSRKPSVDLSQTGPPTEQPQQRRRLQLLPRSKPIPGEDAKDETPSASRAGSDDEEDGADAGPSMSEEEAKRRIGEDLQEFFAIRDLDEAEQYFTKLPQEHRFRLVDALVTKAIEAKQADAELVAGLFSRAAEKGLCTPAAFEEGFMHTAEFIDDIAVDAPKALDLLAIMMKGAGLDKEEERRDRIVNKSMDKDKLISLLSS
ncbi:hypothetical protein GLOTRDRAFT_61048 [Gloeophyllum trabeum ATCC 11539]|uniref:MI domain-containing protein n=1 Tax=Gloeophyllum trabeum (strain ATCC 11539 / FP-39264 / Madison 617) TaxID=670483 RepID=S7Q569_GLOTA|nr:uncharacterized protein GLOTRDRAFT_61048 [Gloeophyllum trabeum ATCC 11539]EPQ55181.1 hypothetical protein GLOTRDRAFT_61048 [Gloeophyllum trabeum ATCC 11539]